MQELNKSGIDLFNSTIPLKPNKKHFLMKLENLFNVVGKSQKLKSFFISDENFELRKQNMLPYNITPFLDALYWLLKKQQRIIDDGLIDKELKKKLVEEINSTHIFIKPISEVISEYCIEYSDFQLVYYTYENLGIGYCNWTYNANIDWCID